MSLQNLFALGGNIQVTRAKIDNIGTYENVLTATVDNNTKTVNFTVVIKDPCSSAVFQDYPAPLIDMKISIPSDEIATQNIKILTDVQIASTTIICPITATLTPSKAYISLSADFKTLSVQASYILKPTDYGTQSFTLNVNSANYPSILIQKTYKFNVIISCSVTRLTIDSKVPNTIYLINQEALTTAGFKVI
jgi:hypothetical protein